jgi:hypothetical protein
MKQLLTVIGLLAVLTLGSATQVFADTEECTTSTGSYGLVSTTCKVLGSSTDAHTTVGAGVGDMSFWMVAGSLFATSGICYGVARLTQKVYWFD